MILIDKIFNLLKIKKPKISPLSNTENNFKFSKGDRVIIKGYEEKYAGMEGSVLEVANHSIDGWVYQVSIDIEGFDKKVKMFIRHIQYFGEDELDYTLQRKRDDRLKELGI